MPERAVVGIGAVSELIRVLRRNPGAEALDVDHRVDVVRFIQRQGDRAGEFAGDGEEGTGGHRRRVEEFTLNRHETTLRLHQVQRGLLGVVQRQLEYFETGAVFQAAGRKHLSAEHERLSFE